MLMHMEFNVFYPCLQSVKVIVGAPMLSSKAFQSVQDLILNMLYIIDVSHQFILVIVVLVPHNIYIQLDMVQLVCNRIQGDWS